MTKQEADALFEQVAQIYHTTVEAVRAEILLSMEEAQQNTDPMVQARWNAIPRAGKTPTIEELLSYLLSR